MENISLFSDATLSKIRCKMNVNGVRDVGSAIRIELGAVYSSRPDSENKSFSEATPCAFFSMDISKSAPASRASFLQPGAQVYVDLSLADIPEWNWSGDRYPEVGKKLEIRLNTLDSDSITGVFDRQPDAGFAERGHEYPYPVLVHDDGTVRQLYANMHNMTAYYWKYIQ